MPQYSLRTRRPSHRMALVPTCRIWNPIILSHITSTILSNQCVAALAKCGTPFLLSEKISRILTKDMLTTGKDPSPFLFSMFVLNIYSKCMDFIACWEPVFVVCLSYYWSQVVVDNPMIYYFGMSSYITLQVPLRFIPPRGVVLTNGPKLVYLIPIGHRHKSTHLIQIHHCIAH